MQIDRRMFLVTGSTGLVLAFAGCGPGARPSAAPGELGLWLAVASDGIVTLRLNATDLGQGAQTGLAQIVADELDADWASLRVELAPVTDRFLDKDGDYFTGGSSSIRERFQIFAQAGAAARSMLINAGAQRWSVDPSDCSAVKGHVVHRTSGRTWAFGALALDASKLPVPDSVNLKPATARNFVGRSIRRLDIPDKVRGQAIYGIDVVVPGMLYAAVAQCPYFGGTLKNLDKSPALAVTGVHAVLVVGHAVIVVADKYWRARKGLAALHPEWTPPQHAIASDDAMFAELRAQIGAADSVVRTVDTPNQDQIIARVEKALAGPKIYEASYGVPLLSHSPMEPMNATAHVSGDGCEIWAPTQNQKGLREDVAKALRLDKAKVVIHTTKVGGGFGRRLETDYGVLAAQASVSVGRPVKLIWSREEDMSHDFYRPASACRIRAAISTDGLISAIDYSGATTNDTAVGGIARNYPGIDVVIRQKNIAFPLPVGAWRSVDPSITVFFLESLIDEIAHADQVDPLEFRKRLLGDNKRALRTLETAARMANWRRAPQGRVQGLAFFASDGWKTNIAEIVELTVDPEKRVTFHRVYCAIDPGVAVNPDQIRAQVEGGILMGLSAAMGEAITIRGGRVEQTNFDSYRVLKMASAPEVVVEVLETEGAPPGGVGEPPVPPIAPALANAIFAATGKRIRALPFSHSGFSA